MPQEPFQQIIDLSEERLQQKLSLGFCRLSNADILPLDHVYVCLSRSAVSIKFWGDTKGDWRGTTLVYVKMYKYPGGKTDFLREQKFYKEDRTSQATLPEGIPFEKSTLRIKNLPSGWTHDAFARSGRDFVHLYYSKKGGVLVHFLGKKGTILDNPLIERIASKLRIEEEQWIVELPKTETRESDDVGIHDHAPSATLRKKPTRRVDLAKDKERIRRYILKRIKDYPVYENNGPGEDEDPIQAIMLGFYAAQGGYIYLVFDTRPGKNIDGNWTLHIDESTVFNLPKWTEFYEYVCDGNRGTLVLEDGTEKELKYSSNDERAEEKLNAYFGEMLRNLIVEMSDDQILARLPLKKDAFMMVEEFDGFYFWPNTRSVTTKGRIRQ